MDSSVRTHKSTSKRDSFWAIPNGSVFLQAVSVATFKTVKIVLFPHATKKQKTKKNIQLQSVGDGRCQSRRLLRNEETVPFAKGRGLRLAVAVLIWEHLCVCVSVKNKRVRLAHREHRQRPTFCSGFFFFFLATLCLLGRFGAAVCNGH